MGNEVSVIEKEEQQENKSKKSKTAVQIKMGKKNGDSDKSSKYSGADEKEKRVGEEKEEFVVKRILKKRIVHGKTEYLLKWKGHCEDANTWESEESVGCPELIAEFEKNWKINEDKKIAPNIVKKRGSEASVIEKEEQQENKSKKSKTAVQIKMGKKNGNSDKSPEYSGADEKEKRGSEENEEFVVKRILKKRLVHGKTEYLLKWKGHYEEANTWESEESVGCPELIAEFEKNWKINEDKKIAPNIVKKRGSEVSVIEKEEQQENKSKESKAAVQEPGQAEQTGFDRGLQPDTIIGATNASGELMFLMTWKDSDVEDFVPARQANTKCPQVVISFYEERLFWYNNSRVLTVSSTENECSGRAG